MLSVSWMHLGFLDEMQLYDLAFRVCARLGSLQTLVPEYHNAQQHYMSLVRPRPDPGSQCEGRSVLRSPMPHWRSLLPQNKHSAAHLAGRLDMISALWWSLPLSHRALSSMDLVCLLRGAPAVASPALQSARASH